MKESRGKLQHQGALAGDFKYKKIFYTALTRYEVMKTTDSLRDDLPNLLWPLALAHDNGASEIRRLCELQQHVVGEIGRDDLVGTDCLDGTLTGLDRVPTSARAKILSLLCEGGAHEGLIPPILLTLARVYPSMPGRWLLHDPYVGSTLPIDDANAITAVADMIVEYVSDAHLNALTKFVDLAWHVAVGEASFDASFASNLQDYPGNPAKHQTADALIRSRFAASRAARYFRDQDRETLDVSWCKAFWDRNWTVSHCLPAELVVQQDAHSSSGNADVSGLPADATAEDQADEASDLRLLSAALVSRCADSYEEFLCAALSNDTSINLYDPAKHEVICGLISRTARLLINVLRSPHLWCGEYAATLSRCLAETEIHFAWMAAQGAPGYRAYQDFGRGREKLMNRHMQILAEELGDHAPEELARTIEHTERKLGGKLGEDFVNVDTSHTFAGRTLYKMAEEVELLDLYRYVYGPASGTLHGEWWAVENDAMQRCLNPLHRFHQLPSFDGTTHVRSDFAEHALREFERLVGHALDALEISDSR